MYLVAGLGNPGKEYENTRHNVGFECIDLLAEKYDIVMAGNEQKAIVGKGYIDGTKVILAKPQTYMNLSGESIEAICEYYKIDPQEELIVLSDDIALDTGRIRIRKKGSAGGHNGLKNIIACTGTQDFKRVRIGVGEKPKNYDLADWVLGHFSKEEKEQVESAYEKAVSAIELILKEEIDKAMNDFN